MIIFEHSKTKKPWQVKQCELLYYLKPAKSGFFVYLYLNFKCCYTVLLKIPVEITPGIFCESFNCNLLLKVIY